MAASRRVLLSAAWQQSSLTPSTADPENKLYARIPRRRLDFEAWRDSMLSTTCSIDLQFGGASKLVSTAGYHRRTLYSTSDRQDLDPMLRIHDFPDPGAHSPWRAETITPLQQLFALNGPFVLEMADALTKRLDPALAHAAPRSNLRLALPAQADRKRTGPRRRIPHRP